MPSPDAARGGALAPRRDGVCPPRRRGLRLGLSDGAMQRRPVKALMHLGRD